MSGKDWTIIFVVLILLTLAVAGALTSLNVGVR